MKPTRKTGERLGESQEFKAAWATFCDAVGTAVGGPRWAYAAIFEAGRRGTLTQDQVLQARDAPPTRASSRRPGNAAMDRTCAIQP